MLPSGAIVSTTPSLLPRQPERLSAPSSTKLAASLRIWPSTTSRTRPPPSSVKCALPVPVSVFFSDPSGARTRISTSPM